MKDRSKGPRVRWQGIRTRLAATGAVGGFSATVLFALCNGALGVWYASFWHGSICIYYILLSLLRGTLLTAERMAGHEQPHAAADRRRKVFRITSVIVLVMNLALAAPVSLMVLDRRPIRTGLVPAIVSAAYTTYKVSTSAVRLKRAKGTILEQELSLIRFVDALVSVLVLQNTLIVAVDGGISPQLFQLVAVSSAAILLLIFIISVVWFVRGLASPAQDPPA